MGLIATSLYKNLCDRAAQQATLAKAGFNNMIASGTAYYPRVHEGVPVDGDYTVENALITSTNGLDNFNFSGVFFKNVYNSFLSDLDSHVQNKGAPSTDSYLNTSGINLHPDFDDIWFRCKGIHLDARNVFFSDANVLMASYFPTGSGTGVFTTGTDVGIGTGKTSPTNHAAAKAVLIPVGPVGSATQINVRTLFEQSTDGSQAGFANILIPNGTTSGTQFILPINPGDLASGILSVSNIVVAGGTSGNGFIVMAIREREITL